MQKSSKNTRKPNAAVQSNDYTLHNEVVFTPEMQRWFSICKPIYIVHNIKRMKVESKKDYLI